jgi:hypothetical protein
MKFPFEDRRPSRRFAAEHGGDAVKGGGHPADDSIPAEEAIEDGQGRSVTGRGKVAGTADPGVPGSRTNPVNPEKQAQREDDRPAAARLTEGSGSGS